MRELTVFVLPMLVFGVQRVDFRGGGGGMIPTFLVYTREW